MAREGAGYAVMGAGGHGPVPGLVAGTDCRMEACDVPGESTQRVNHETIYLALYALPRGELRSARPLGRRSDAGRLNGRPRKVLGFQTPAEVFQNQILNLTNPVAFQT